MGSLKNETKGPIEDHQRCEMTEDREYPETSSSPEEEGDRAPRDAATASGDTDHGDVSHIKDCIQNDVPLKEQPDAEKPSTVHESNVQNEDTVQSKADDLLSDLSPTDTGTEIKASQSVDKDMGESLVEVGEQDEARLPVSPADDTCVPPSPAPPGQQHIHTQVSLEVVQCHSVATSPMTPPQGDQAFSFPYFSGKFGAVAAETKDAELQVGREVEFRSVATAPMTPRTPTDTVFPETSGRENVQMDEKMGNSEEQGTGKEATAGDASPESPINHPTVGLVDLHLTLRDRKEEFQQQAQRIVSMDQDITILVTHHGSTEAEDEEGEVETESFIYSIGPHLVKQDETAEVNENNYDAEERAIEEKGKGGDESNVEQISKENSNDGEKIDSGCAHGTPDSHPAQNKTKIQGPSIDHLVQDEKSQGADSQEDACRIKELEGISKISQPECSTPIPPIPVSPASSGCHHIQTQVSLEVVQCHSVATSPMTPPEGDHVFSFPICCGTSGAMGAESKDAELQVGWQVEVRSVATAPMTPKTPTGPIGFLEINKEERMENKILEEDENGGKRESVATERETANKEKELMEDNKVESTKEKKVDGAAKNQVENISRERGEEKCEEPVQDVSWDETGMTWEVYGAVVEVAVLGSAIQKHLEKQVKKHRKQPSMHPPPPLNPSAVPLPSTCPATAGSAQGGSGKGRAGKRGEQGGKAGRRRRNPFRLLLQNMQQPHCCSRAHTSE
ncbi:G protein-regulated inducer of neurite outgrowth 3 [Lampris incognitus]|uniref:G protein-regulated inducer of neurite outgrowth 3 n=1 Tax=Lampris incognitus TaxID=2546036 RepID=UPI0024B5C8E3|nr:G protein-regulated inducer of neurite outgrowth 3 [Lampris incognitus]